MFTWIGRGSLVRRGAVNMHLSPTETGSMLCYSSWRGVPEPRGAHSDSSLAHNTLKTQPRRTRPRLAPRRLPLLDYLRNGNTNLTTTADVDSVAPAAGELPACINPPKFVSAPAAHGRDQVSSRCRAHSAATATPLSPSTASAEMIEQQRALRECFTHARQHHNVRMTKDSNLYRAECRAFRQAHRGRSPTPQEVSRTVAVPLAPVAALKTLAHTNPQRSSLHATTKAAVVLHNAVVKNELVKSNSPQLVRCLRCFHVYTARPRTLWGDEVQQSFIEYEKAQKAQRLQRPNPGQRPRSVGRRQRACVENPTCCPMCGSPRAQWMMEFVHHHTHERM